MLEETFSTGIVWTGGGVRHVSETYYIYTYSESRHFNKSFCMIRVWLVKLNSFCSMWNLSGKLDPEDWFY